MKANFPLNDLFRRRFQTILVIITLTLSVASTLFLLFFSDRVGIGIFAHTETLTLSLNSVFSQFILYLTILIFIVGAILSSFIVLLMMSQRTRDFGLIKAAGCPNSLTAGYFMTELLTVTLASCFLGIALGFVADYFGTQIFFSTYQMPNVWFAPLVFAVFFILAFLSGVRPLENAAKMSPAQALSPVNYFGLLPTKRHKPLSKTGITWKISTRSLSRHQTPTVRIVILLSVAFTLLTLSIAGGVIARETTVSWIESPIDENTLAIAHSSMGNQFKLLLSNFSETIETSNFNYSDPKLAIPETIIQQLNALPVLNSVDSRLILKEHTVEVANFTIDPSTATTYPVGDHREADFITIGVDPEEVSGSWSMRGRFLEESDALEAVVGDSVARTMFSTTSKIRLSDPLVQSMRLRGVDFRVVGVCIDPLANGFVNYVPLEALKNVTAVADVNFLLIRLNNQVDHDSAISEIKNVLQAADSDIQVFELSAVIQKNMNYLSSMWSIIMLLPTFTLASAAISLVGYMMLTATEQSQELAILRAMGAKPKIVIEVLAIQSLLVLLSSFGVGLSFGVIITLLILVPQPLVTIFSIVEISAWYFIALIGMFTLSLYPAIKLARSSILKNIT